MATGRNFSLVLRLLVFLSCIKTTQRDQDDNGRFQRQGSHNHTDTHSLSCNITVKVHTTPQHPQCEVQCSLDEVPFLWYDNDNKATHLGDLGKAVHATQVWTDFIQRLESLGQELRKTLADTKQETTETSGHRTLQATMLSKYEQGQIVDASWRFNISGKNSFFFNKMNMNWTPIRKS